jgi:ASCH domain
LVRDGLKKIEVRSWTTKHRGDLLICAAKSADAGWEYDGNQPRGVTICLVTLLDVRLLRRSDVRPAMLGKGGWILNQGSFAWLLGDPRPLKPRPTRGQLGIFDVPSRLIMRA